jgi:hypothetical protein
MHSKQNSGEIVGIPPDVLFLKDILGGLIFLAAASGTIVFFLL